MSYKLKLTVNNDTSALRLFKDEELAQEVSWPEERDMGKQLLSALKQILDESKIRPEEVAEFLLDGEAKENFTSRRIAETVQKVYTFAINQE